MGKKDGSAKDFLEDQFQERGYMNLKTDFLKVHTPTQLWTVFICDQVNANSRWKNTTLHHRFPVCGKAIYIPTFV